MEIAAFPTRARRTTALQVVAVGGAVLSSLIPMAIVPAMPAMAAHFGSSENSALLAQMIMAVPAAMIAVASPLGGVAAERFGLRPCLLTALAVYVIAGVAGVFITDAVALLFSRVVLGAAGGVIATLAMTLTGLFQPTTRDRLVGLSSALGGLAAIVGLSAGGALVDEWGWRAPFTLYLLGLPFLALAFYSAHVPAPAARGEAAPNDRLGFLWPIYALMLVFSVGFFTPGVQGPFLLAARGIDSAAAQGGYISLFALVSALTSASYGLVRKVADERAIAIATGLSLGIGLAGLGAAAQPTLIGIALVLGGIGSGLATPTIVSMLLSRAPDASRPRAIGFCYTAIFLGQFLNPLLLEPVRRLFGVSSVFFLTGFVLVVAGLAAAGRVPHRR